MRREIIRVVLTSHLLKLLVVRCAADRVPIESGIYS